MRNNFVFSHFSAFLPPIFYRIFCIILSLINPFCTIFPLKNLNRRPFSMYFDPFVSFFSIIFSCNIATFLLKNQKFHCIMLFVNS